MNRIQRGRLAFDVKARQQRRQMVNNFIMEEKVQFDECDKIRDNEHSAKKSGKDSVDRLEDTIVLTKKINQKTNKLYADIASRTHQHRTQTTGLTRSVFKQQQERQHTDEFPPPAVSEPEPDNRVKIRGLNGFSSEKRIGQFGVMAPTLPSCKSTSKPMFASSEQNKRTEHCCSELIWQPSESSVGSAMKINRVRPKSSIMTKERHEHTMKNIKKHVRRDRDSEDMNSFIETRFLKKPEVVLL